MRTVCVIGPPPTIGCGSSNCPCGRSIGSCCDHTPAPEIAIANTPSKIMNMGWSVSFCLLDTIDVWRRDMPRDRSNQLAVPADFDA